MLCEAAQEEVTERFKQYEYLARERQGLKG